MTGIFTAALISAMGRQSASPLIGLHLGAAMHGDGAGSVIFQDVRHFQIIARLIVPAQPDFAGDGHRQGCGQPIEQLGDFVRRAQQARARAALTDLGHRAAHVDVDGARAAGVRRRAGIASPADRYRDRRADTRSGVPLPQTRSTSTTVIVVAQGRRPRRIRCTTWPNPTRGRSRERVCR